MQDQHPREGAAMTSIEKKQKSFVLYNDYMEYFALLSLEERGALITAILQYVNAGEHNVTLSGAANMAYHCIRQALDRDRAAYERRCEMNARRTCEATSRHRSLQ